MTWVTCIENNIFNNLVTQNVFDVPNEIRPILVTCFLGNELQDVYKKTFGCVSKSTDEKEKEKKKERQLQGFLRYMQTQKLVLSLLMEIKANYYFKN